MAVDISDLKSKIDELLEGLTSLSPECCIYSAPLRLRLGKEKSYTPKVVSIGPLHHGKQEFQAMEEHKIRYLNFLVGGRELILEDFINIVKRNEEKLRNCYAKAIEFRREEFVKIILVDATFIIAFLLKFQFRELRDDHDRIFGRPWMMRDIWLDILLLENQLPFFILCDLYNCLLKVIPATRKVSIFDLSLTFVKVIVHLNVDTRNWVTAGTKHFVDLLRRLYLNEQGGGGTEQGGGGSGQGGGGNEQGAEGNGQGGGGNEQGGGGNGQGEGEIATPPTPSVTDLSFAGATFKVASGENPLGLKFENGVLEIPKLIISEETETLLRNVLAFEQCYCNKYRINEYVFIKNQLVNSQKDVEIMVKYGIMENMLANNKQGSFLMNNLIDGVCVNFGELYFARLCKDLDKYYQNSWRKWMVKWMVEGMVELRQKHFKTPWTIISVFAGATLLILTFIQTVYSTRSSKLT